MIQIPASSNGPKSIATANRVRFHIFTNPNKQNVAPGDIHAGNVDWVTLRSGTPVETLHKLRLAFLCAGVDISGSPGGWVSGVHAEREVAETLAAFERVVEMLQSEGEFE